MIINIVESLIAAYFFTNYFDLKINKRIYYILNFIPICLEINIVNSYIVSSILLQLLVALTATLNAYYFTKNNLWEILFITFFDELIVGLSITISLLTEEFVVPELRTIIAKILYFLIVYLVIYVYKSKEIKLNPIYWKLLTIVAVVFYFAYAILLQFYLGMKLSQHLIFITLLSLGLSVIGIAVMVYYISKLEREKQETQFSLQKLEMEQSNYKQLNEVSKEIKIMRHDLKHDYLLIENYLEENKYSEIKEMINSRVYDLEEVTHTVNSENKLINTIINYKKMIAQSKNIKVKYKINVSGRSYMKDYHLNELLSNLLDNAIENCSKNNSQIDIVIEEDVFLYIEVVNQIDKSVLENNPNLHTSKIGENHGHGIKSIQRIVNEYGGSIKFFEKDLEFHVSIIIPINHPR